MSTRARSKASAAPSVAATTITRDEWAEAFRVAVASQPANDGDAGLTREELTDALGVAKNTASILLRKWYREGRLIAGFQVRAHHGIDGRPCRVPVYRIK